MADLAKKLLNYSGPGPKVKYKDIGDGYFALVVSSEGGGSGGSGDGLTYDELIEASIGTRKYNWAGLISVNISSSNVASDAVGTTKEYEISSDTDCYIMVGTAPIASTSTRYLPAGGAFTIQLEATDKVAVIRKSADGKLTILPIA